MNIYLKRVFVCFLYTIASINCYWFNVQPLHTVLERNPSIIYHHCFDKTPFNYHPFPLGINPDLHPNKGYFNETFVLQIPHGIIQSQYGWVITDNTFIDEMIWKRMYVHFDLVQPIVAENTTYISGSIAVITQLAYFNYWHWLTEVLCRLALLELANISYDKLYVPQSHPFMKETLELWGIDKTKILLPSATPISLQADMVILPSLVSSTNFQPCYFACYAQPDLIQYVKNKLLPAALQKDPSIPLSKKIFISRKDAPQRRIINEDEVFALLQPYGFVRYELSHLSIIDQIHLFHNAEIIVSPQGTCLANSIFCKEGTKIIELFQGLNDCTFWYLSQDLHLDYTPVATGEFNPNYIAAWKNDTEMSLHAIQDLSIIL